MPKPRLRAEPPFSVGGRAFSPTNPKVLAFYLAVLPQFLPVDESPLQAVPLALTHAVISALYLAVLVLAIHRARGILSRRRIRRWMDALTGTAMLAFGARLATEAH